MSLSSLGNDEEFLDPDEDAGMKPKKVTPQEKFKPRRDGELFLYVNDAALAGATLKGYLRYFDYFYRGNSGTAQITVERIPN